MARKRDALKYDLVYHIPVEVNLYPKANIQYRTDTHVVTYPKERTIIDPSHFDMDELKSVYRSDGWTVIDTDSGFTCAKDGFTNEYSNIRMERI